MEHEAGKERTSQATVPKAIAKRTKDNERVRNSKEHKLETAVPVAQRKH